MFLYKSYELALLPSQIETNLYIRPNPDSRINRKPDRRIIDQTAELIKNRTAEFDH